MIGFFETIIGFFTNFVENLENLFETLILLLEAPIMGLETISEFVTNSILVIPEIGLLAPICAIGVVFIIIDILRDLL